MSMPEFPEPNTSLKREQVINAILMSIAMEETALSHIINAEGEKIQYAIEYVKSNNCSADLQKLLEVNESAASLIERINEMQIILKSKLRLVVSCLPPNTSEPTQPCSNQSNPSCQCTSIFSAIAGQEWFHCNTLRLEETSDCKNSIKLCHDNCGSLILLPCDKKFKLELYLEMINKRSCPITIEILLQDKCSTIFSEKFTNDTKKYRVCLSDSLILETLDSHKENILTLRLHSPQSLKIINGKIMLTEVKMCV